METILDRARERSFAGVRLVQAAFHNRSLALYTSLGFFVREPLSVMQGPPLRRKISGYRVAKQSFRTCPNATGSQNKSTVTIGAENSGMPSSRGRL